MPAGGDQQKKVEVLSGSDRRLDHKADRPSRIYYRKLKLG